MDAIRWHSTACAGMRRVGLVVFLADKLDPNKTKANPLLRRLAGMAQDSLDTAAVLYLTYEMGMLLKSGSLLHPASLEARNYLLLGAGQRPDQKGRQRYPARAAWCCSSPCG